MEGDSRHCLVPVIHDAIAPVTQQGKTVSGHLGAYLVPSAGHKINQEQRLPPALIAGQQLPAQFRLVAFMVPDPPYTSVNLLAGQDITHDSLIILGNPPDNAQVKFLNLPRSKGLGDPGRGLGCPGKNHESAYRLIEAMDQAQEDIAGFLVAQGKVTLQKPDHVGRGERAGLGGDAGRLDSDQEVIVLIKYLRRFEENWHGMSIARPAGPGLVSL